MTQAAVAEKFGLSQKAISLVLEVNCADAQKTSNQEVRARENKTSRRTQVKIDKVRQADPELAAKVEAKEIGADTALRQLGLLPTRYTIEATPESVVEFVERHDVDMLQVAKNALLALDNSDFEALIEWRKQFEVIQ